MISTEVAVVLALVIGVFSRTILPYLKKKSEDPNMKFDLKFLYTCVGALVSSILVASGVLSVIPPELLEVTGVKLFLGVFAWCFQHVSNDVFNEMVS